MKASGNVCGENTIAYFLTITKFYCSDKKAVIFSGTCNRMYNHVETNSVRGFNNQRTD